MQQPNTSKLSTVSPPESGFTPRPEFIRENHIVSSFALLSIAGSGFVRLSSFSNDTVTALKTAFKRLSILHNFREDGNYDLVEFSLEGKPWAPSQSKSVDSEKLFVQILDIIFQHGYKFLSTIDYGRERSERVCITFSRPISYSAYESTRVPFALSFPSPKVLRAVNIPLNSSPAILQAVRSAWPRGVVHEKKVSEKCWEFHLKGYRFFQEDTFATDSLKCIFSLLSGLDKHSFTLLTSLSLSGHHSRIKDFWVFLGSSLDLTISLNGSGSIVDLHRGVSPTSVLTPPQSANQSADTLHGRSGSVPDSSRNSSFTPGHSRSVTEPNASQFGRSSSLLRKKPPQRVTSNVSSIRSSEEFPIRRQNLSTIESMDMTGIGAGNHPNHPTARSRDALRALPLDFPRSSFENDIRPNSRERVKTGDLFYDTGLRTKLSDETGDPSRTKRTSTPDSTSDSHSSSRQHSRDLGEPPHDMPQSVHGPWTLSEARTDSTPAILSSNAFRDSAFSNGTKSSCEIPIAWTGALGDEKCKDRILRPLTERCESSGFGSGTNGEVGDLNPPSLKRMSTPKFPGAWQPTPIEEKSEEQTNLGSPISPKAIIQEDKPERKEVKVAHRASPILCNSPEATRKSEAASFGAVAPRTPILESVPQRRRSVSTPSSPIRSEGWVLVNVAEDDGSPSPPRNRDYDRRSRSPTYPRSSLSPIVKAIAVEDTQHILNDRVEATSGLRRFFSTSKSSSKKSSTSSSKIGSLSGLIGDNGKAHKPSLRDKWRKKPNQSS